MRSNRSIFKNTCKRIDADETIRFKERTRKKYNLQYRDTRNIVAVIFCTTLTDRCERIIM